MHENILLRLKLPVMLHCHNMAFPEDGDLQPKYVGLHKFSKNPRSTSKF
jgi:hypothetical protein